MLSIELRNVDTSIGRSLCSFLNEMQALAVYSQGCRAVESQQKSNSSARCKMQHKISPARQTFPMAYRFVTAIPFISPYLRRLLPQNLCHPSKDLCKSVPSPVSVPKIPHLRHHPVLYRFSYFACLLGNRCRHVARGLQRPRIVGNVEGGRLGNVVSDPSAICLTFPDDGTSLSIG